MVLFPICFQRLPTNGLHAAQTCKNTGAFPHFVCIAVRQGPTLPKWLDISIRLPPLFLLIRTHRLHADQILQSMGTSPNYSNLCFRQYFCCFPPFFVVVVPSFVTKQALCTSIFAKQIKMKLKTLLSAAHTSPLLCSIFFVHISR